MPRRQGDKTGVDPLVDDPLQMVRIGESAYDLHSGSSGGSSSVLAAATAPITKAATKPTTTTEGAKA